MVGVDDHEVNDGVDFDSDVVVGDDLLRWHLEGDGAQVDLDQAVDAEGDDQTQPWTFEVHQPPQPEQDAPFIFVDNPDRRAQSDQDDENDDAKDDQSEYAHGSLLANPLLRRVSSYESRLISALRRGKARVHQRAPAWKSARVHEDAAACGPSAGEGCCCCSASTRNRSPSTPTTRTLVPASSAPLVDVACQSAPLAKTLPLGRNGSRAMPRLPSIDSSPAP